MPLHLRWELHPTPREEISHNQDSRQSGRVRGILAEIRYAAREGLLFQQCFKSNRDLWYVTYPFHIGLFLSGVWFLLLVKAAFWPNDDSWWPVHLLHVVIIICGAGGLILGTAGCAGLLVKRLFDPGLSVYTTLREYMNLCAILLVFVLGLTTWIGMDSDFAFSRGYVRSLVTLSASPSVGRLFGTTVTLFSAFVAFLPFGSLRHGIAKFFTYHRVRWDDERNVRGGELEARIQSQLSRSMTWSAPHVNCTKWGDVGEPVKTGKPEAR
jgi:nitrate reductase gamma subunit